MYKNRTIAVIIPALNEREALPEVLVTVPLFVDTIIVADNGSVDGTFELVSDRKRYPRVRAVREMSRGYGNACLKGIGALRDEDIVVFLDGDGSDDPGVLPKLLDPIIESGADVVISNRRSRRMEKGAMTHFQEYGNIFSVLLIRLFYGFAYRDLGPFRCITCPALSSLDMSAPDYGWTVELQVKAVQKKMKISQVDVPYRVRKKGRSKVSGTVRGTVMAGLKIVGTIFYYRMTGLSWEREKNP